MKISCTTRNQNAAELFRCSEKQCPRYYINDFSTPRDWSFACIISAIIDDWDIDRSGVGIQVTWEKKSDLGLNNYINCIQELDQQTIRLTTSVTFLAPMHGGLLQGRSIHRLTFLCFEELSFPDWLRACVGGYCSETITYGGQTLYCYSFLVCGCGTVDVYNGSLGYTQWRYWKRWDRNEKMVIRWIEYTTQRLASGYNI